MKNMTTHRLDKLETAQRMLLAGLCAQVTSSKLTMAELTDEELSRFATPQPGEIGVRHLSDAGLEAIVKGDITACQA